jgi:hypothetical protein
MPDVSDNIAIYSKEASTDKPLLIVTFS